MFAACEMPIWWRVNLTIQTPLFETRFLLLYEISSSSTEFVLGFFVKLKWAKTTVTIANETNSVVETYMQLFFRAILGLIYETDHPIIQLTKLRVHRLQTFSVKNRITILFQSTRSNFILSPPYVTFELH